MTDPNDFWGYINSKLERRPKWGDLEDGDGKTTHDDNGKSELLSKFFTSIFTQEDTIMIHKLDAIHTGTPLTQLEITPEKFENNFQRPPLYVYP